MCGAIGREKIAAHEKALGDYAMARLGAMNSIRIFGKAPGKGAIVSFEMKGAHAHDVATIIDRSGVAVTRGHSLRHAAAEALRGDLDVPGLLRHVQHDGRGG